MRDLSGRCLADRCVAIAAGLVIDRAFGEPPTAIHPVAWFGSTMGRVEESLWAPRRNHGVAYAATGVAVGLAAGLIVRSTSIAVAVTVAGRMLRTTATTIGQAAESGDLQAARSALPSLVGRDPSQLDAEGIAAAVIESVAENSVDAVIAPVFWAVIGGAPATAAYRAINTMDAMVGHRNDRFEHFGWAAAKLDDAVNYLPARLFAVLVAVQQPTQIAQTLRTIDRDAPAHPSPNAGVAETAVAAALGVELGGPLRYGERVENRPTLGTGPRPSPSNIQRAINIANRAELMALGLLVAVGLCTRRSGRGSLG